ncbi:MAG: putative anti-sigma regulatory factor, serine/threonine protein kinase [Paenibacillus sp.]|jgi:serine/threonine-protein kinase RsbW|nr:putative anti-sigma regulatory factor, serine/threonine protein kinase [Paenibacillus sp.]
MKEVQLRIPAHADHIDLVRICLYGIANKLGFHYEDIEDMKVAVSEACSNAVMHGGDTGEGMIEVTFRHDEQALTIQVHNQGPPFVFDGTALASTPLGGAAVPDLQAGGLGIYLMEALMDKVEVVPASGGTDVWLTKYRQ